MSSFEKELATLFVGQCLFSNAASIEKLVAYTSRFPFYSTPESKPSLITFIMPLCHKGRLSAMEEAMVLFIIDQGFAYFPF